MITEKDTIRCEAVFNEEHTHRYLWKRIWNKDKPVAAVIMLNPSQSDNIITDTTTALVINNTTRLEQFGGVAICNLYSLLTSKLSFRWNSDEDLNQPENDSFIQKAAESSSCIIAAWGRSADTNKRIASRAKAVLGLLESYREKVFVLSDGERDGLHPLTPTLRERWILKPFDWDAWKEAKAEPQRVEKEAEQK